MFDYCREKKTVAKYRSRESHLVVDLKMKAQPVKLSVKQWNNSMTILTTKWCKLYRAVKDKPFWHKLTCFSQ